MMRVLVVADSAIVRAGIETMLREDGRFEPVRNDISVGDLPRLRLLRSGSQPDVVLAEISEKRRLASLDPREKEDSAPVVLLVDVVTRHELQRILGAGVRAVLRRDATPAEIFAAIEAAAAGLTAIGSDELDLLLPAGSGAVLEDEAALETLSAREAEVLALMARGLGNKNIADRLRISEHTVKFHVSSILSKLGAASRTEAVTKGLKEGLLVI
jgi:DNA-binding NarL/FixJ family response regulator